MQFSMTRSLSAGAAISCAPAAGGRRGARGRVSVRPLNAATKEKAPKVSSADEDEDLGPYGNGYKPYPLPFGKERVYVWERPPAGVTADKIFKPRAVPTNHFEQYWYDFLYLYPEMPEWQVKLQAWANEVYGAPKYKWAEIYNRLRAKNLKTVTPEEAFKMLNAPSLPFGGKTILIDVRESQRFDRSRAEGAVNCPYFDVGVPPKNQAERIRQVSYFFLGLQVPTLNPEFVENVAAACGGKKNTRILVMCQIGGTLENTAERKKRNPRLPRPPLGARPPTRPRPHTCPPQRTAAGQGRQAERADDCSDAPRSPGLPPRRRLRPVEPLAHGAPRADPMLCLCARPAGCWPA